MARFRQDDQPGILDCLLQWIRVFIRIKQTVVGSGDDHDRQLYRAVVLTQTLQTRTQRSFIMSASPDVIRSHPYLRDLLGVLVLHVLRVVGLLSTPPHDRAPEKRRQGVDHKLSDQRHVRNERPPLNSHTRIRGRRQ